jgi:HEAT repeat protein/TolA-binding protein
MKHFTLRLLIVGVAVPVLAVAQVSPVPPSRPPRPAPRVQPPQPPQPPEPFIPDFPPMPFFDMAPLELLDMAPMKFEFDQMRLDELQARANEMSFRMKDLAELDVERLAAKAEQMRFKVEGLAHLDVGQLEAGARQMELAAKDFSRMNIWGAGGAGGADNLLTTRPRTGWAKDDPADSLYRAAREALNRGEYRRAAQLFNEVTKKFPKSEYALDCTYWEAFSRYRAGGTDDLRQALRILDEGRAQLASLKSEGSVDVQALRARVQGALAARGDEKAAADLKKDLALNNGCDREEISVRAEALGALGQMDRASAMPVVRKVLARRDDCTVELRRRALFILARDPDADAVALIIDVAKNDTDQGIRGEAMRWLPRVAGDNAVPQLEELLKTSTDEQAQRSAIAALGSIDSDRARKAVRTIIERNDASERVRYGAILNLSREREGRAVSTDEINYLRSLYQKIESPRLREAVLTSVSRIETPENVQFLLGVARNENETTSLRATALQRLGRMTSVSLNDVAKLYDVADSRSLREQILYALFQRKEPEAVDKIIEIARKDTDPQIRRTAISLLARRDDPRARKWLQEIIDK